MPAPRCDLKHVLKMDSDYPVLLLWRMLELTRLKGLAYSALLLAVKQNKNRIKCLIDELTDLCYCLQYLTTVV